MTTPENSPQTAMLVPDHRRGDFLPSLFGQAHLLIGENTVYSFMEWLSPLDYDGGFWNFYEHHGTPLFLAPTSKSHFRIYCDTNGYEGEVSAEAAGIIATLFTFSHLSFRYPPDHFAAGYNRLYAYVNGHPEAAEIYQAID